MSLVVNHNMMAANTARNLNAHYNRLATSTQRLSTGLRINSAADDAAGLAIRELQRADIAALQQGARNANDAISLIQTADGALGVIDEKLIRMKELAEQAATGTYDSTQRLMIESEYQQMASEITRIANATDFNGMKLLDGTLSSDKHDGSGKNVDDGLTSTGKMKIHFGSGNDSAEDYYYIQIGNCTAAALGVGMWTTNEATGTTDTNYQHAVSFGDNGPVINSEGYLGYYLATTDGTHSNWVYYTAKYDGTATPSPTITEDISATLTSNAIKASDIKDVTDPNNLNADGTVKADGYYVNSDDKSLYYIPAGGTLLTDGKQLKGFKAAEDGVLVKSDGTHVGVVTDKEANKTAFEATYDASSISDGRTVSTQEQAQKALVAVNNAIVSKDKIRAHLGALQNRFENTITNLNVQAENLQAAESRISDVDVATEMTQFVRNQILTQSAVAMLSQANSLPQMAMQLIGG